MREKMAEAAKQLPQLLTIAEAAKLLGLDIGGFRKNFVNRGLIEVISLGRSIKTDRFHPDEVARVLASIQADAATPSWDMASVLAQCETVYMRGKGWVKPQQDAEYLYVLSCHDAIKVGISRNPVRRVKDLQAANPFPIEIELVYRPPRHLSSIDLERMAHDALRPLHLRSEWFKAEALKLFVGDRDG